MLSELPRTDTRWQLIDSRCRFSVSSSYAGVGLPSCFATGPGRSTRTKKIPMTPSTRPHTRHPRTYPCAVSFDPPLFSPRPYTGGLRPRISARQHDGHRRACTVDSQERSELVPLRASARACTHAAASLRAASPKPPKSASYSKHCSASCVFIAASSALPVWFFATVGATG